MEALGGLLIFGVFFVLFLFTPATRTRWPDLEEHYRFVPEGVPIREDSFSYVSCRLGSLPFQLAIEIHKGGLYLQVGWPLRIAMPSVLIPWDKIRLVYVTEGSLLTRAHVELEIEHYPLQLLIPGRAGEETARWIKQEQGLVGPGPNYFFPGHGAQETK